MRVHCTGTLTTTVQRPRMRHASILPDYSMDIKIRKFKKIGAKLDPPNDPNMANILEQYGVVNRRIG